MFEYYDNEFARGRLNNTIITIDGRASLVNEVVGDQDLEFLDLEKFEEGRINIRDPKVSVVPPRLGYVKIGDEWMYRERIPERRWKQGIPLNLICGDLTRRAAISIGKSLNGKFPGFNIAKRSEGVTAFSIHFAICSGTLLFKGKGVGTVSLAGHVQLSERFIYLKEYFEESVR